METTKKEIGLKWDRVILYLIEQRVRCPIQDQRCWEDLMGAIELSSGLKRLAIKRESSEPVEKESEVQH
jgi:hypothetical protein